MDGRGDHRNDGCDTGECRRAGQHFRRNRSFSPSENSSEGGGCIQFYDLVADFGDDFDLFKEELDGDERYGSYEDDGNGLFSEWQVDYAFEDDYEATGISLFGFITTCRINELEGDDDYFGILFRTGPSELINVRPASAD